MNRKINKVLTYIFFVALMVVAASNCYAKQTVYPTGVTIYNPEKAYNGYLLDVGCMTYTNHPNARYRGSDAIYEGEIYLRDMNGNVVHSWEVPSGGTMRARFQPNGNLFVASEMGDLVLYDWNGKLIKSTKAKGIPRNDATLMADGNILYVSAGPVPKEFTKDVKDCPTKWWGVKRRKGVTLYGDSLLISDWEGNILWEWHSWEHLDVNDFSPMTPLSDWTHGNTCYVIPENKWYNSGDKRFKPGNILYNPRNLDTIVIVDKDTKEIVWSWTHNERGGLAHCHEPRMIEKGLPGAGDIILFDNGLFPRTRGRVGQSILYELNPQTGDVVWRYDTKGYGNMAFFSKTMGSEQRLPNGNTFISEDDTGRVIQVATSNKHVDGGEVVWEYISKHSNARSSMVPYDYSPQLRALKKHKELKVTPPHNWHMSLKPDALRKNKHDFFEFESYEKEAPYPPTTAFSSMGYSMTLASVDELMYIEDIKMTRELAEAIYLYSRENGGFRTPRDLLKVPGMTEELFSKLHFRMSDYSTDVLYDGKLKKGIQAKNH